MTKGEYKGANRYCDQSHADPHFNLSNKYSIYGIYNLQTLNYNSFEQKLSSSTTYQIGLRNDNLLNQHISMDLKATTADSYGSSYDTYEIQFSRGTLTMCFN